VSADRARFGFEQAPVDLEVEVTTAPDKLVRMHVTSGFPYWEGSTWEWELGEATRSESGTGVLFRHYGFSDGYAEIDLGHTAQTWALISIAWRGWPRAASRIRSSPQPASDLWMPSAPAGNDWVSAYSVG